MTELLHVEVIASRVFFSVYKKEVFLLAAKRFFVLLLVLTLSVSTTRPAHADIGYVKDSKAVGVIVAAVAVGAVIGFGVYYAIHHGHSLTGCTTSSPSGLEIISEGSNERWVLIGATQEIKAGDRIHVGGSKSKRKMTFTVTKLSKDYGACSVPSSH